MITSFSSGSNLRYFLTNSMIHPIGFSASTAHFFFFIIGASPVAFNKMSTGIKVINDFTISYCHKALRMT